MAVAWIGVCMASAWAQTGGFELAGDVLPAGPVPVYLQGATKPFDATTEADLNGRFHFRKLLPGAYVLMVGGLQRTVEIGPSLADLKGRVSVTIDLRDVQTEPGIERKARVSLGELSIPRTARREYDEAEKALERREVAGAVGHFKRAVEIAPRFSAAWNHLGTIAYQTGHYAEAESDFRKGLEADPNAYAPLVNLGGVLINLSKWGEALEYNQRAVRRNPQDALANSQLGMAYYYSDNFDSAEKYLSLAKQIDPAHFSQPQVLLAEIHLRRNEPSAAAEELEDLLQRHPDLPNAPRIKDEIARLRAAK